MNDLKYENLAQEDRVTDTFGYKVRPFFTPKRYARFINRYLIQNNSKSLSKPMERMLHLIAEQLFEKKVCIIYLKHSCRFVLYYKFACLDSISDQIAFGSYQTGCACFVIGIYLLTSICIHLCRSSSPPPRTIAASARGLIYIRKFQR